MKVFIFGFLLSIITNFFLFNKKDTPVEIIPSWKNSLTRITAGRDNIKETKNSTFPLLHDNKYLLQVGKKGNVLFKKTLPEGKIYKISDDGKYYAAYEKTGTHIEYYSSIGLPFWKKKSQEYPFVSPGGKLVLLMVSDLSSVRAIDFNGNFLSKPITGKACTNLVFSSKANYAALGFLDGSYYIINEKGEMIISGKTPELTVVKSLYLSSNGKYLAVHYGDTEKDYLKMINSQEKTSYSQQLPDKHVTKTALYVDNNGRGTILNKNQLIITGPDMEKSLRVNITPQMAGQANISKYNENYLITYRTTNNSSKFMVVDYKGNVIKDQHFKSEKYLANHVKDNTILLRGENNLYCWTISSPE